MKLILEKINYVKILVPKSSTTFNFETLYEGFNKFRSRLKPSDKYRDDIMVEVYKKYASLNKLLHERNGMIERNRRLMLAEEVTNMINASKEDSNRYLPYFSMLATIEDEPLTIETLQKRFERIKKTHEFTDDIDDKEILKREQALLVAYFVLSKIIEENGGIYNNPDRLMEMEAIIINSPEKNITWETKEDTDIYEEINQAKTKSAKKFLPVILLKPINGKISKETIEKNYNVFLDLNPFGKNIDHNTKAEFETIYQSIQNKVSEYANPINNKKDIINTYGENTQNVDLKVAISMMLRDNPVISSSVVLITLKDLLDNKGEKEEDISNIIKSLDIEFCYIVLDDFIKNNNGKCTSEEAREILKNSIEKIEEYKQAYKRENKNPLNIFPINSGQTVDERYYSLLYDIRNNMKTNSKTIEDIYRQKGLIELCKEYYNIVKNPEKRRELENIKFDVDQSDNYYDIGISDIQCIRNSEKRDIITLENSVGDKINITEVGKLGYSAMERNDGEGAIFTDATTTSLYLVTKQYHNTECEGKFKKEKQFLVFSEYLVPTEIKEDPILYSLYADQIFSDISLETAIEKNGRLIATPTICKCKETGENIYNINFNKNTLSACIELVRAMNEFDDITDLKDKNSESESKVLKRIKGGTLIGDSNVPLSKGYASTVMIHENGKPHEDDVMLGFEWSNKERVKTIFNLIKSVKSKEM